MIRHVKANVWLDGQPLKWSTQVLADQVREDLKGFVGQPLSEEAKQQAAACLERNLRSNAFVPMEVKDLRVQALDSNLFEITYTYQPLRRWRRIPVRKRTWRLTRRVVERMRHGRKSSEGPSIARRYGAGVLPGAALARTRAHGGQLPGHGCRRCDDSAVGRLHCCRCQRCPVPALPGAAGAT